MLVERILLRGCWLREYFRVGSVERVMLRVLIERAEKLKCVDKVARQ